MMVASLLQGLEGKYTDEILNDPIENASYHFTVEASHPRVQFGYFHCYVIATILHLECTDVVGMIMLLIGMKRLP